MKCNLCKKRIWWWHRVWKGKNFDGVDLTLHTYHLTDQSVKEVERLIEANGGV